MSTAENATNLEELDPRYSLLAEYFARGWVLLALHGVAEGSTMEQPSCLCGEPSCGSPGKHPRGTYKKPTGTAYVRSLEEAVRKLPPGTRWNVGLAFGQGAGAEEVALDIESETALEQIRAEYGFDPLGAGAWARTGRGYHALYRLTSEQLDQKAALGMGQGAGEWAVPEVDVRVGGTNGYVVIEPSIHPSGREYRWEEIGETTEAPNGFLELMATRKNLPAAPVESRPKVTGGSVVSLEKILGQRDHSRHRAEKLLETVSAKVMGAAEGRRNSTVKDAAYALGGSLYLWPESEQASYRERLKEAAAVQTPPGDPDYAERRHTVEESWKAGASKGSSDPIPPPSTQAPRPASSMAGGEMSGGETESEWQGGIRRRQLSELGPPRAVRWLEGEIAEGRIPRGELSLIMGEPGVGKGSIAAQIVAEVTNAGRIVIVSAPEDDLYSVVLPRFMAAGAKLANVIAVEFEWAPEEASPVDILEHSRELLEIIAETSAALLYLDPIAEHMKADAKSERETRAALRPLLSGCRELECAVLGVDHVNRMSSSNAYARAGGSSAKYKVARSVLIVAKVDPPAGTDPAETANRPHEAVLASAKLNVGKPAPGLRFEIGSEYVTGEAGALISTSSARLLGESRLTSEELLGDNAQLGAATECAEWLRGYLEEKGGGDLMEPTRKAAAAINADWKAETLGAAVKVLGGKFSPLSVGGAWGYRLSTYKPLGADRH